MLHYGIVLDCCLAFSWQTCSPQNDLKVSSTEFSLETTKSLQTGFYGVAQTQVPKMFNIVLEHSTLFDDKNAK